MPNLSVAQSRDQPLDLIKWLAIITMLLDHTRLVWPSLSGLAVIGRWAFPLFCLAIAANVYRARHPPLWQRKNARYLGYMLLFALISEYPYHLLSPQSITFNIMPTLAMGLLLCWCVAYSNCYHMLFGLLLIACAYQYNTQLMYGWLGVLLPAACLLAITYGRKLWWLAALIAALANVVYDASFAVALQQAQPISLISAALATVFGLGLLWQRPRLPPITPVGHWGYWFYPLHLLALYLLGSLITMIV
jgi:hypothetical protein